MEKKGLSMPTKKWINRATSTIGTAIHPTGSAQHWYLKRLDEIRPKEEYPVLLP